MNTPEHSPQPLGTQTRLGLRWHRRKAVALILVISFIVLLSALVVSFFSRVTTDLASSRAYAEGVTVRQLADSAVGVVMGQIREATTLKNACWGSQPGMIRTYRAAGGLPGPNAYAFYKLYSSHDLIVSGREIASFDPSLVDQSQSSAPVEVPLGTGGWDKQAAFFTDINEPVDVPDPSAGANSKTTIKRYPIFDPSVAAIYNPGTRPARPAWKVEGCEIALKASDRAGNDAPMPVRWVYILRDGTLTAPTPLTGPASGTTGLIAPWSTVGADKSKTGVPTKDNPIVGRIAFWTDDDSCKVNVNTAGGFLLPDGVTDEDDPTWQNNPNLYKNPSKKTKIEKSPGYYAGSFWDTPRVQTFFERGTNSVNAEDYRGGLSNSQPGQNEFQRYPGHPSTTSLGLVFKNLLPAGTTGFTSEKLYVLTPRLQPGGSKNGTVRLDVKFDEPLDIKTGYPPVATKKDPNPPTYHLFASVDEFFYSSNNASTNDLRVSAEDGINQWVAKYNATAVEKETALKKNTITPQLVDQTRFFLTANSRSPELNLFGRPRVAIWPVPTAKREANLQSRDIRNPSDDLIRFCATVGRDPNAIKQATTRQGEFIFDREDPYSSTVDFLLPRNQKIFSYLRDITSSAKGQIPGFGGSFETKYNGGVGGRDQILTEIFDYIRTVNQKDGSREKTIDEKAGPAGSALNNQLKAAARYAPHALVVPTRTTIDGRKVSGFGRYPTISEASVVFYHGGFICVPKAKSDLEKYAQGTLKDAQGKPMEIYGLTDKGGVRKIPGNPNELVIYDLNVVYPGAAPIRPSTAFHPLPFGKDAKWVSENVEKWTGQLVRAFVIFETFNPMQGYAPVDNFNNISLVNTTKIGTDNKFVRYNYTDPNKGFYVHELEIESNFSITTSTGTKKLTIGEGVAGGNKLKHTFTRTSGETYDGRNFGGTEGFFHTMQDSIGINPGAANYYKFQSPCADPLSGARVAFEDTTFQFSGGNMYLNISYEDKAGHNGQIIQKVTLTFPPGTNWPLPTAKFRNDANNNTDLGGFDARMKNFDADVVGQYGSKRNWDDYLTKNKGLPSGWAMAYHLPSRIAWASEWPHNPMGPKDSQGNVWGDGNHYTNAFMQILQPGDTIRSLVIGGGNPAASDPRIAALQQDVTTFQKHPDYDSPKHRAETLRRAAGGFYFDPSNTLAIYQDPPGVPTDATKSTTGSFIPLVGGAKYKPGFGPDLVRTETYNGKPFVAKRSDGGWADFDTGIGSFFDGAFAGKADEGNVAAYWYDEFWKVWHYVEPYFTWVYDNPLDTYFSPNRQVPGPVMFGSLSAPQGDWSKSGWQTLLFCPNPAGANHPGARQGQPPDHLLLDLFSMPVVEPYAISEPFSTAGKVNLNYPLVPFGYIKRTTALRAALHPLRVTAIPQNFLDGSKQFKYKGQDNNENLRYLIDRDETLKAFDLYFDKYKTNKNEGFFKSASQICDRYLYPKGLLVDGTSSVKATTGEGPIKAFWDQNQLTGDNVREKPYADLYPRITTKSNTYTVHYRVQTLRKRQYTGNAAGEAAYYRTFDERTDKVMSELRGHATIERYLDSEDARFQANYTPAKDKINVETESLEEAYRFRIISNKRFSPW